MVAAPVLPKTLQAPDYVQLPVGKMLEEAVAHEPDDVFPVVVALVGDFLLQNRADRNHRGEGVPENEELQKEFPAQKAQCCCQNDGYDSKGLQNRRK